MGDPLPRFVVLIPYREPVFELRIARPPDAEPYWARYEIRARSAIAARNRALREFQFEAQESGVRWARELQVDGIKVERLSD